MRLRGSDYNYSGIAPHPTTAILLKNRLSRRFPAPAITPVLFNSDPGEFILDNAKIYWDFITQGYGIQAEYGTMWKAGGVPLTIADEADLHDFVHARCAVAFAAYEPVPMGGDHVICPRNFYSLIEQSEKVAISYSIGSAMTKSFGEHFIAQRAQPLIVRMYHARLLKAAAHCQAVVPLQPIDALPDYLGKAVVGGQSRYHVFESKGGADISYAEIAKGIRQATYVQLVNGAPPLTHNVCVTHHRVPGIGQKSLVTRMLQPEKRETTKDIRTRPHAAVENFDDLLDGIYLCGMALFLSLDLDDHLVGNNAYRKIRLDRYGLSIAIRVDVLTLLKSVIEELREPSDINALVWLRSLGKKLAECDRQDPVALDEGFAGEWSEVERTWLRAQVTAEIAERG